MRAAGPAQLAASAARRARAAAAPDGEPRGVPRGPGRPAHAASEAPAAEAPSLLAGAAAAALLVGRRRRRRGPGGGGGRRCEARLPRRVGPELPSVLNTVVGKKELKGTIAWVMEKHGMERTVKILERLKESGFSWATRGAVSLGIDDLVVPKSKGDLNDGAQHRAQEADMKARNGDITVVEKFLKVTDEWKTASEAVKDAAMKNFKENDPNNPVYMMSASGARGNVSQVRQLLAQRGLMADATGQIIDVPIKHCLREGMTASDMLVSSNGARKGMIDTALGTADSGYLYRRLDFAASSQVIRRVDCGTTESVPETFHGHGNKPAPLRERIRGRILAEDVVEPKTGEVMYEKGHLLKVSESQHVDKVWKTYDQEGLDLPPIMVRSTLTCEAPDGICARCYGEDMSKPGTLVALGTPVGVIAAQSMGEPGTQLTMRTFHTGGAFEGGAFEGTQAAGPGTIHLVDSSGQPVVATGGPEQGHWSRLPQGDAACTLVLGAELRVVGADGGVIQEETVVPGARVRVQHGEQVTLGQVLFEVPPRKAPAAAGTKGKKEKKVEVEKIPKPILSDESGEVFVTEVEPGAPGCVPEGSKLVWVLQGCCVQFRSQANCALTVRPGDTVEYGTPLAVEWATAPCAGVPRLQLWQPGQAPAEPGATGWRQFDWRGGAAEGAGAAEGQKDPGDEEYSLRVDFDEAACLAGPLSEYHAVFEAPAALRPPEPERRRINMKYKTIKIGPVEAPPSVSVLTHKGAPAESEAPPEISLACVAPSQGAGSVVSPVCRRVHPHVVVPLGGLVFVLPSEGGGQAVLWSPEEVHRLCMPQTKLELLVEEELRYYYAGTALPTQTTHLSRTTSKNYSPLLTTSIDGMVCIYRPTGDSSDIRIVDEGAGILRRECWDRAVGGQSPEESFDPKVQAGRVPNRTVECVVKPGTAVAVSAHLIDDSWYSAAKDGGGGVHLHQKLVPPGTPFLPGKPSLKSDKDWWVVELLQDPGSAEQGVCWLVVRPARLFEIPAAPEPAPPHTAKAASFWHVPFVNGEVVASLSPVALAHEVTLSIGRSPSEPHCVTAALDESGPAGAGSGRPAAADPRRPAAAGVGPQRKPGGARLELIRDSVQGRLRIVQHSPLGPPARGSVLGGWQEAPASYTDLQRSPGSSRSTSQGSRAVPQRTLPSPADGLVCRADVGERDSSVVVIRREDCVVVPCRSRPAVQLGALVRQGNALSAEDKAPCAGQVLSVEEQGDGFLLTLRKGHVYLVTEGGKVMTRSGSIAAKGDVLGTVDLAVPKTADIVQGLPKINSMFEVAKQATNIEGRLDELWEDAKKQYRGVEAAKMAIRALQMELPAEIQSVYREQGVSINAKHIELVVRQMTNKCLVVQGAGLLKPGSLVSYLDVEAAQALMTSDSIVVRPVVRGITRVGMDNHVLVGMGFREVDNVLLADLVGGPALHPLSGIKENLMIGKAISAGTNAST